MSPVFYLGYLSGHVTRVNIDLGLGHTPRAQNPSQTGFWSLDPLSVSLVLFVSETPKWRDKYLKSDSLKINALCVPNLLNFFQALIHCKIEYAIKNVIKGSILLR